MQLNDLVCEWLKKAELDVQSANFLYDMRPTPRDIIGFHCQQAVEKCFKAILVLHDIEPPRSHDLLYLNSLCLSHSELPIVDRNVLSILNPYSVEHRYPGEIAADENDIAYYLKSTTKLVNELRTYAEALMNTT